MAVPDCQLIVDNYDDIMEEAPSIDPREAGVLRKWTGGSWDEMSKDAGDGMPGWLAAKVRQLRPVVETGYENTLLMGVRGVCGQEC